MNRNTQRPLVLAATVILTICFASPSYSDNNERISTCIQLAKQNGYRDGQCAHGIIEACLTGSQKKMNSAFSVDSMLGMVESTNCPNMPDKYAAAFDNIFQ